MLSGSEEASQIKIMHQFAARMNNLTLDILDIIDIQCDTWFKHRGSAGKDMISVDEFLQ